ncbi:MAG: nitrilase family protein [Peptococcaceae bacterium]|nr:nitrilase family protein [Peptococcaceae bacterium]
MERTRIALVQMQATLGAVRENLQKIESFTAEAAGQKADIICFPELCVPCYSRDRSSLYAEPVPGESSRFLARLAGEHGITVLAGLAEKPAAGENRDKPFITHLVAFPDGTLQKYRKTHLGRSELPYYSPGDDLPVFTGAGARFAVQICWDLHFPEVSTILSLRGAEIIFAPHASPAIVGDRKEIWLKYLAARAYDNTVFLAACNLTGGDGAGNTFCGGALVLDPKGNVLAESFGGGEGMLVADLDPALINTIRGQKAGTMRNIFFLAARRPELYGDLLKGLDREKL